MSVIVPLPGGGLVRVHVPDHVPSAAAAADVAEGVWVAPAVVAGADASGPAFGLDGELEQPASANHGATQAAVTAVRQWTLGRRVMARR
jgi:hypothetical protein